MCIKNEFEETNKEPIIKLLNYLYILYFRRFLAFKKMPNQTHLTLMEWRYVFYGSKKVLSRQS